MAEISNSELIREAQTVARSRKNGDYTVGDVGCALLTDSGNLYLGVCIDTGSGMGFCAEHNAIGSMITGGESRIKKIVAVWQEGAQAGILSPCGRCRQFIIATDAANIDTEVILAEDKLLPLRELLPFHDWCHRIPCISDNLSE